MASGGFRVRRSTSLRRRGERHQSDEEAGFAEDKRVESQQKRYKLDTNSIQLSTDIIGKAGKKLFKVQEKISRKEQQEKSKKLGKCKENYDYWLTELKKELKRLNATIGEKDDHALPPKPTPGECSNCFHREKDKLQQQAEIDRLNQKVRILQEAERQTRTKNDEETRELRWQLNSLNKELSREREAKQDALTRLSAITSSRLRDNNPNLTDLSDPHRPSKIGEMFSELYDNEWTSAYDELCHSKTEVEAIQLLNKLVMSAYDCCLKLSKPIRTYLDTSCIKIDSEFRQKIIAHFKQNAVVVVQDLSQILQKDVCARCNPALPDSRDVNTYIRRCIEICWLMVVQDPPMVLDNTKPDQFDTARYRGYQHNGPYTAYIVWPAIRLHNDGPLLSKGVAEGTKSLTRPMEDQTFKQTGKSRPTDDRTTKQNNQMSNDMSRTWHPTRINVQNARPATSSHTSHSTEL